MAEDAGPAQRHPRRGVRGSPPMMTSSTGGRPRSSTPPPRSPLPAGRLDGGPRNSYAFAHLMDLIERYRPEVPYGAELLSGARDHPWTEGAASDEPWVRFTRSGGVMHAVADAAGRSLGFPGRPTEPRSRGGGPGPSLRGAPSQSEVTPVDTYAATEPPTGSTRVSDDLTCTTPTGSPAMWTTCVLLEERLSRHGHRAPRQDRPHHGQVVARRHRLSRSRRTGPRSRHAPRWGHPELGRPCRRDVHDPGVPALGPER
jgi:hypothetical protein